MIVPPPPPRYRLETAANSTIFSVPARKEWISLIFMCFWLLGWACGEVFAGGFLIGGLLGGLSGQGFSFGEGGLFVGLFLLVWLAGWTFGGLAALSQVLWQLSGREIIEVSHNSLRITRRLVGLGRPKEYLAGYIQKLQVGGTYPGRRTDINPWKASGGMVSFNYGMDTVYFGAGLTAIEARTLIEEIQRRYSEYRDPQSNEQP